MPRMLIILGTLVTLASSARGDTPKAVIRGPAKAAPGSTVVLDARSSVADRPLRWKIDGPEGALISLDQEGRQGVIALIPSASTGVYKITLIARGVPEGQTEVDADAAIHILTVEPPAPAIPAGPPPEPEKPKPTPVTGTMHVSLVVDLDEITPTLARLREAPQAREAFSSLDTVYRTYSHDSPDAKRLNLMAIAGVVGLPAVVIQNQNGKVIWSGRAPPDEASLISLVTQLREGN